MEFVRKSGRRIFLGIEALFNRAFGDRLNPFYRLGEIAFYLFWIVAASGLYLYAFFKTGVHEAYSSVQAFHTAQPWIGGILRSAHRYASDALVVTMLLHLVRHFCFDRYRGYRWFSWITGVVVLWLVYASGINGFMLPWDRLAQFVVVATTEWLDWLPLFSGRLARNFITDAAVSDRLFSLLSFLHIGIPLVLLLVLWIHIQRVPRARTVPPAPIAVPIALMLVAMSVAAPILGSDAADLASLPTRIDFDWFYLATFAVMYDVSTTASWAMLIGGTALLVVLPWLPPRRGGAGWRVVFHPGGRNVLVRPDETLLDAGLREGIALRYECRAGGCGKCKARVTAGNIDAGIYQDSALSADERALGTVLTCCARPTSDAEVEFEASADGAGANVHRMRVTVTHMVRAAPEVMILELAPPPGERMDFEAGQYFNVILEDGARRAFSFATAPGVSDTIEMHVRLVPGGRFTTNVFESMREGDVLEIEGPLGEFRLADSPRPLIFVAGATGFAPAKSIIEHALRTGVARPIVLYWGVRHRHDLYVGELPGQWAVQHPQFRYIPVLSAADADDAWAGRTGFVHEAILADVPDLSGHDVYACGSVAMIETARPAFLEHGLAEDACFTDSFVPNVSGVGR